MDKIIKNHIQQLKNIYYICYMDKKNISELLKYIINSQYGMHRLFDNGEVDSYIAEIMDYLKTPKVENIMEPEKKLNYMFDVGDIFVWLSSDTNFIIHEINEDGYVIFKWVDVREPDGYQYHRNTSYTTNRLLNYIMEGVVKYYPVNKIKPLTKKFNFICIQE